MLFNSPVFLPLEQERSISKLRAQSILQSIDVAEVGVIAAMRNLADLRSMAEKMVPRSEVDRVRMELDRLLLTTAQAEVEGAALVELKAAETHRVVKSLNQLLTKQQDECALLSAQLQVFTPDD